MRRSRARPGGVLIEGFRGIAFVTLVTAGLVASGAALAAVVALLAP